MKMNYHTVTVVLLLCTLSLCAKLPYKKCNRQKDFQKCLAQSTESALRLLTKNYDEVGLKSLDPFLAGSHTLPKGPKLVEAEQKFQDIKIFGLKNAKINRFDLNFATESLNIEFLVPELKWECKYDINGKIASKAVAAKGSGFATFANVKLKVLMTLHKYTEAGKDYFTVISTSASVVPDKVSGLKLQGVNDATSTQYLQRSKEMYTDVQANYEEFFAELVASLFNSFLTKVPISELFE